MTAQRTAIGATWSVRWRGVRWVVLALVVIVALALASAYLSAPRPGGRLDPESTSSDGGHALVALLRGHGVTVIEADTIQTVQREARADTLLLAGQTYHLYGPDLLRRLADLPGDRLLIEPLGSTREALAPQLDRGDPTDFGGLRPDCDLREANRAGSVRLDSADTFVAAGTKPVTRCYQGALARYTEDDRTITVLGSAAPLMNGGLLDEGNAALAMNLAGTHSRLIWYAPQQRQGDQSDGAAEISDLIPPQVGWMVWQLVLAVTLLALWKGRRIGPLVAERLPVVVRASETVEGRGRLYRSRRARGRAADALRTSALQRMLPRLGLGPAAAPDAVVQAVGRRCGGDARALTHTLYGPPPATDTDLVSLARALDDIERQVAQS